ncbi:spermatogenesis-associated protein 7 homolog isoform 2-T2 [Odontesthes bonariensis]|uniref:spermatogenesis-associated protein 7 homolog isoform X2 n=1 Tax=Odontesthes bonariensis TaxID=219752 RepID=UPI003F585B59
MGYAADCNITMESRTGSVSSGLGSSHGVRGQTLKSNPFCPRSSSKLTQSIVKDHMVSHYKKVYSAKDNDQIRQERLRKEGRPQSAHSFLQRSCRTSCSPAQSRLSVQCDSPYLCSTSSIVSSPRFTTSFNAKDAVYPLCKVSSRHIRPASETKYRSPETASQREQSACSVAALRDQGCYKTFQDPVQKTYSGDLIQKHSQHFTQDKPFTPRTLKSDKNSYLSKYRYYRAPPRKPTQDCSHSRMTRQETYHGSTKNEEYAQDLYEQSQEYSTEHEWSEDEASGTYLSASRHRSQTNRRRHRSFIGSSSRFTPEGVKSPTMTRVSAEEEELMYLEFISAVTEDILSRGHISDRVLDRVMKRHIDMNLHRLDEGKMRHLLEVLRKDFEEPVNISTSDHGPEKKDNDLLDSMFSHMAPGGRRVKTKEDNEPFTYVSLIKHSDLPGWVDPVLASTPTCSPERTSSVNINEEDGVSDSEAKGTGSPLLSDDVTNNKGNSPKNLNREDSTAATDDHVESNEHSTVNGDSNQANFDGQLKELEDLGRSLSALHVSSDERREHVEPAEEQHPNVATSVSDDEFF